MGQLPFYIFDSYYGIICFDVTKRHNGDKSYDFDMHHIQGVNYIPPNQLGCVIFVLYCQLPFDIFDSCRGIVCSSVTKSHNGDKYHDFGQDWLKQCMAYTPSILLGGVFFVYYVS